MMAFEMDSLVSSGINSACVYDVTVSRMQNTFCLHLLMISAANLPPTVVGGGSVDSLERAVGTSLIAAHCGHAFDTSLMTLSLQSP